MAKLTVIFGTQASGKTNTAHALTRGKKTLFIKPDRIESPFCFDTLYYQEMECVVFDEYPLEKLDWIVGIQRNKTMTVKMEGSESKSIKTPQFYIVISNAPSPNEVMAIVAGRNFDLIECKRKEVTNG